MMQESYMRFYIIINKDSNPQEMDILIPTEETQGKGT